MRQLLSDMETSTWHGFAASRPASRGGVGTGGLHSGIAATTAPNASETSERSIEIYHVEKQELDDGIGLNDGQPSSSECTNGVEIYRLPSVDNNEQDVANSLTEPSSEPKQQTGIEVYSFRIPELSNRHCTFNALQSVETMLPGTNGHEGDKLQVISFAPSKCVCPHCQTAERPEKAPSRGCLASL